MMHKFLSCIYYSNFFQALLDWIDWFIKLITFPIVIILLFKYYFIFFIKAIKEAFLYSYRSPHKLTSWITLYQVIINCQTNWLLKKVSFYHQDKPELLEELLIEAYKDWRDNEQAFKYNDYSFKPELNKIFKSINRDITKLDKLKNDPNMSIDVYLKKLEKISEKIWKIHKYLWV